MSHPTLHDVEEAIQEVYETITEEEQLLSHSMNLKLDHWLLRIRNAAVLLAAILFLVSMFHIPGQYVLKAVAYFLGAVAYFTEILLLTDCFRSKVQPQEMFMAYCFGPMYILLGLSYLLH